MWTNREEALSDFVLAAAAAIFGPWVVLFLVRLIPAFRSFNVGVQVLQVALVFVFTGVVPLLLARYRGENRAAFGLDVSREGLLPGVVAAVPVMLGGFLVQWAHAPAAPGRAVLGVFQFALGGPLEAFLTLLTVAAVALGGILLYPFLTVKGRSAFERREVTQLEALRTYGLAAAASSVVIGLLVVVQRRVSLLEVVIDGVVLAAVVLLADRLVPPQVTTSQWAVLAPAGIALALRLVTGFSVAGLRSGLLAGGFVLVVAVLVESRRGAWAVVPLFVAVAIWGVDLRPIL